MDTLIPFDRAVVSISMKLMYEVSDLARECGLTADAIRAMTRTGRLTPTATTPRGVRLFDDDALMQLRRERAARPMKPGRRERPLGADS
jgi:MerR-like DNA binding protein